MLTLQMAHDTYACGVGGRLAGVVAVSGVGGFGGGGLWYGPATETLQKRRALCFI